MSRRVALKVRSVYNGNKYQKVALLVAVPILLILALIKHTSKYEMYTNSGDLTFFNSYFSSNISSTIADNDILPSNDTIALQREREAKEKKEEIEKTKKQLYSQRGGESDGLQGYLVKSMANKGYRPKAAMIMYIADSSLEDVISTISNIQDKFNNLFEYPWIIISLDGSEYDNSNFIDSVNSLTDSHAAFVTVDEYEFWSVPDWIDNDKYSASRVDLSDIQYGDSQNFRHTSRYFTHGLFKETFMKDLDWYWRIEPGSKLFCELDYDIFRFMQDEFKVFAFGTMDHANERTTANLFKIYEEYSKENDDRYAKHSLLRKLLLDEDEKKFSLCEFDVSFSIVNMDFWRSKQYTKFFQILDKNGGIFYNRWSADFIQTVAAVMLLPQDEIQFFSEIGYEDPKRNVYVCPFDDSAWKRMKCNCDPGNDRTFSKKTCMEKYYSHQGLGKPDDWDKLLI